MQLEQIAKIKMIEKGLSYSSIARLLRIPHAYVSDIIKEKRIGIKYKKKILKLLDIPYNYYNLEIRENYYKVILFLKFN